MYLARDQQIVFCGNLATLPHDGRTWLIAGQRPQPLASKLTERGSIRPSLHWS